MPHDCQEEEGISASPPYQVWRALEGAIQAHPHLPRLNQVPPLLRIHLRPLRPWPCHLLRVECLLALLSAGIRHRDHQLLRPQSHQYVAFHQREPGPWALDRHLVKLQSILRPHEIFTGIQALLLKSSSRHLRLPRCPFRAIQIVELGHFTPSFTWTWRLCDSSQTFGIHLDCSRGTISSD